MKAAIRRLQLSAAPVFHSLHQRVGGIAHVILKIGIFVEIIMAGRVGCKIPDVSVDQSQMA